MPRLLTAWDEAADVVAVFFDPHADALVRILRFAIRRIENRNPTATQSKRQRPIAPVVSAIAITREQVVQYRPTTKSITSVEATKVAAIAKLAHEMTVGLKPDMSDCNRFGFHHRTSEPPLADPTQNRRRRFGQLGGYNSREG